MPNFSKKSKYRLATCNQQIQDVFNEVIKHVDCTIVCGLRTTMEQKMLYAQGRTMPGNIVTNCDGIYERSNHQSATGISNAVDAVPYPIDWNDRDRFIRFIGFVQGVASQMGIELVSGLDWDNDYVLDDQSFTDLPHFETKNP